MIVLSGLVGAAIGSVLAGGIAWLLTGRQIKAQADIRHLNDLREVVGDFWGAADVMWQARIGLSDVVFEMQHTRTGDSANTHYHQILEGRRQDAFSRIRESQVTGSRSLGLLRMLEPELAAEAGGLWFASSMSYPGPEERDNREQADEARAEMLERFEVCGRNKFRSMT